jgi:hypothetical protein
VAGRSRRGAEATERRGRTATRPGSERRDVQGSEREQGSVAAGADMRARPTQCRVARFEMNSSIFTDSNRFKNLQI